MSAYTGGGRRRGIFFRDFIRPAGQQWGGMERYEASKGGESCHGMTSGEGSKPLLWPPAQENQLSCMEHDRVGAMGRETSGLIGGTKTGRMTGQRDGQRDTHTDHPHPTGLPPDLLLGAAVNGEKYPVSKIFYKK